MRLDQNTTAERGAVALLTTIIIGILLTIITTGLISLMISELRQSNDAEQSVRAYYAAQSGVEDAISKVIAALPGQVAQVCPGAGTTNTNLDPANPGKVGWTCQQISYSGSPTGSLPLRDKSTQIEIGNVPAVRSMSLQWDLTPPPFAPGFFNAPVGNFPDTSGGWDHPAVIEVALVEYPAGSFVASAGTIVLRNALVVPTTGVGVPILLTSLSGNSVRAGSCNAGAGSYHCTALFTGLNPANSYIVRLRSRYVGSDYKLTFLNAAGGVVQVPDGTATIDITAKAGDAFRRVVYKVPFQNGAASGLDYVIYSDTDVCKNFGVISGAYDPAVGGTCPSFP
jgi:hypothetical protein